MSWFKRKQTPDPIVINVPVTSRVEIELHKNASQEAAKVAIEANKHLNDLLLANGFNFKLFLAAGGRIPRKGNQ